MNNAGHREINPQDKAIRGGERPVNDTHNWTERVYFPLITGDKTIYR